MPIVMRLDRVLADRKLKSNELAAIIGTSVVNLSNIKTGKIRGIRFSTLEALCEALDCQPGDLMEYVTQKEYEALLANKAPRKKQGKSIQQAQSNLAAAEAIDHNTTGSPAIGLQVLTNLVSSPGLSSPAQS